MKRLHLEHEQPAGCWEYMFSSKELVLNKVELIRQTIVEPKQAVKIFIELNKYLQFQIGPRDHKTLMSHRISLSAQFCLILEI